MSRELVESVWGYLIDTYGEFAVATLGTFIFHEVVYFGWYLPYFLIDTVPFLKKRFIKYKIQPVCMVHTIQISMYTINSL